MVLTKIDVFEERLKHFPYENYQKKLNDNNTPLEDIIQKFKSKIKDESRLIVKVICFNTDDIIELLELAMKNIESNDTIQKNL